MTTQPNDKAVPSDRYSKSFPHHRLEVCRLALDAMVLADKFIKTLPRGYASLGDQIRRASQSVYLQSVEGAARFGADQRVRFQGARAEACEVAGAAEGALALRVGDVKMAEALVGLYGRIAAMLTALRR